MSHFPRNEQVFIYHITDVSNLVNIVAAGGMKSDIVIAGSQPEVIGYDHIKKRRAEEISISCCGNRFVGEFVPFYFCPRSPMLYTVNLGKTGHPVGCQQHIIHLMSTVNVAVQGASDWAISDGNAGTFHTSFYKNLAELENLDWNAIQATYWEGLTHQKSAEFLVADFFPWASIQKIGCHNRNIQSQVAGILDNNAHFPVISIEPRWYY